MLPFNTQSAYIDDPCLKLLFYRLLITTSQPLRMFQDHKLVLRFSCVVFPRSLSPLFYLMLVLMMVDLYMAEDTGIFFASILLGKPSGLNRKPTKPFSTSSIEIAWLDHLPLPSFIYETSNFIITQLNPEARKLFNFSLSKGQKEEFFLKMLMEPSTDKDAWASSIRLGGEAQSCRLTTVNGSQFFAKAHFSAISPAPDPLMLVQISDIQEEMVEKHFDLPELPRRKEPRGEESTNSSLRSNDPGIQSVATHTIAKPEIPSNVLALARNKSDIATWAWDKKNGNIHWSSEFYDIHQIPFTTLPDLSMPFPFMSQDTKFDLASLLDNLNDDYLPLSTEYEVQLANGTRKDFILGVVAMKKGKTGETEFLSGILQDVTKIRELERVQTTLVNSLLQKQQTLKEFSTALSHRLRVPVAQLQGLLGLVISKVEMPPEHQMQILNDSTEQLDRAIHELNQLLSLEKIADGIPRIIKWNDMWKPINLDLQERLWEAKACVSIDFSATREVFGVKEYFQGIITELLNNALKFRDESRPLELQIHTETENGTVWFHIQDNGIGMDIDGKEAAPFEIYRKFHSIRSGKGLGLHLVKLWVEMLQGKISIHSIPNQGTRVSFGVPAHE